MVCWGLAVGAHMLSAYVGGPYMLYALALGMGLGRVLYTSPFASGIGYTAKKLLRIGVALLGAQITFDEIASLGFDVVWALCGAVIATIIFGIFAGRILGVGIRMGVLTGGAIAICGASAAMAVSSVLPQDKKLQQQTLFTVVGVNVLSSIAMVLYPFIALGLGYNAMQSGVFLGGSIHDVAQVIGAGFSISDRVGNLATISKLLRVAMLLPIVFCLGFIVYWLSRRGNIHGGGTIDTPFPFFLLGFLGLVALNSMDVLSIVLPMDISLSQAFANISKWILTMAVIALGMQTSVKEILLIGHKAIILMVLETIFIAVLVLGIVSYMI